jgi:hypothetical protein
MGQFEHSPTVSVGKNGNSVCKLSHDQKLLHAKLAQGLQKTSHLIPRAIVLEQGGRT